MATHSGSPAGSTKDQQHPQEAIDQAIVQTILAGEASDYHLAEAARLLVRYRGFPGARQIQRDLQQAIANWGLNEADLFARTRAIHARGGVYQVNSRRRNEEDWS